ncbi:helix-turn-helix domain-containing protein [Streptomyces sparsogenes]|uniref:helix-turn-helix domain-containing protein n=1 Tax=Streptomyces sparsogenes TaxID=67365 RepID=UPI0033C48D78
MNMCVADGQRLRLGGVRVSVLRAPAPPSPRVPQPVPRSAPERWQVALVVGGTMRFERNRDTVDCESGDLLLYDAAAPSGATAVLAKGPARAVILHLPEHLVPVPGHALSSLTARPIPARPGPGALLGGFLRGFAEEAAWPRLSETGRLGSAAVDLAVAFLAHLAEAEGLLQEGLPSARARQEALLREVKGFVLRNLGREDLSPATIAAAHHISVRYLHQLFQREELTVRDYVRERRLERARADLADASLAERGVGEIGRRWGFPDGAAFSRAFRKAYGVPPGEYRRRPRP